jgi:hypothetical protein
MTAVLSGTNGLLQAYDYQVLTTAFAYTFAAGTQVLVMNPAGTLATGTITMPASPADGMTITVESTQQVTAVTVSANTGQSIVGSAVQLIPNQPLSWVYRLTNTTWYPLFGGAGRASALVSGTSQATTSGTSITFSSIPSWVKRITVMYNQISGSGTSNFLLQIGAGSTTNTGYVGNATEATTNVYFSAGFLLRSTTAAANTYTGVGTLSSFGSNTWVYGGFLGINSTSALTNAAGVCPLSGTLDRVILTTANGTDTFDAGSINILYE